MVGRRTAAPDPRQEDLFTAEPVSEVPVRTLLRDKPKPLTPVELSLHDARSLTDAQLAEELAWHEARMGVVRRQLRARKAAAASAAARKKQQASAAAFLSSAAHAGGYGSVKQAATDLGVSRRTIARWSRAARDERDSPTSGVGDL